MELSSFLTIMGAGFVGTTVMVLVMGMIHGFGWADADMVRAVGSLYTRREKDSFTVGVMIHYTAGLFFALLYALAVAFAPLPVHSPKSVFLLCTVFGLFHGFFVSALLVIEVAEHHPLQRFRKAGLGVVLSHLVGHICFGASVGLVFVLTGLQFNFPFLT